MNPQALYVILFLLASFAVYQVTPTQKGFFGSYIVSSVLFGGLLAAVFLVAVVIRKGIVP
jgi:hypothetical protein